MASEAADGGLVGLEDDDRAVKAAVGMATAGDRGRGLALLAVQQQLRAAYGIKVKSRAVKRKPLAAAAATGAEEVSRGQAATRSPTTELSRSRVGSQVGLRGGPAAARGLGSRISSSSR